MHTKFEWPQLEHLKMYQLKSGEDILKNGALYLLTILLKIAVNLNFDDVITANQYMSSITAKLL